MFQCLMIITITKNNYQGSFIDWGFIREAFYAKLTSISGEGKPVFTFGCYDPLSFLDSYQYSHRRNFIFRNASEFPSISISIHIIIYQNLYFHRSNMIFRNGSKSQSVSPSLRFPVHHGRALPCSSSRTG